MTKEVVPWACLKEAGLSTIKRMAYMIGALDEEGIPVNGLGGIAIKDELLSYAAWAEESATRRDAIGRRGGKIKEPGDPRHLEAKRVVSRYLDECKKTIGVVSSTFSFGSAVKLTYKALDNGWNPEELEGLAEFFFACSGNVYVFRDGSYKAFIEGLLRLKALRKQQLVQVSSQKKDEAPVSLA